MEPELAVSWGGPVHAALALAPLVLNLDYIDSKPVRAHAPNVVARERIVKAGLLKERRDRREDSAKDFTSGVESMILGADIGAVPLEGQSA